jgi:hypothetical protein
MEILVFFKVLVLMSLSVEYSTATCVVDVPIEISATVNITQPADLVEAIRTLPELRTAFQKQLIQRKTAEITKDVCLWIILEQHEICK